MHWEFQKAAKWKYEVKGPHECQVPSLYVQTGYHTLTQTQAEAMHNKSSRLL